MRTILLPTDGSTPALVATNRAVEMAKEMNATLVILKVVEQNPLVNVERIAESAALMRPESEDGVNYAQEMALDNGVTTKVLVREGPVVGEIVRAAEEVKADLIIMGTSSLKGLNRLYLGSVAKAVVSQAPTSVVVVKPTSEDIKAVMVKAKEITEESPAKAIRAITRTRQFKVGVYLFAIYTIGYAAFVVAGSYFKDFFRSVLGNLNVGTALGIALIIITIALAIGFNWYAERAKNGEA
jgi:nucleotide-binding universal stress UspA family protein/uncharacterized membrane protein (DUF485 family)